MKNSDHVLATVADGESHNIKDLFNETGCGPEEIESLVKRGLIRPVKGGMLCITPRGIERFYRERRYITQGGLNHRVYE